MDDVVGGYRLLRRLAGEPGDEVWLACRAGQQDAASVVVRLASPARADSEVGGVGTGESPHLPRALDLFALEDGRIGVVTERLPGGSLAELLGRRSQLHPGEAVTILVPVVRALAALHARGISHGGLAAARVLFAADGTPALNGFGRTAALTEETRAADLQALAALATAVLARTAGGDGAARRLIDGGWPQEVDEAERVLFSFAQPVPLDLERVDAPTPEFGTLPARLLGGPVRPASDEDSGADGSHGEQVPRPVVLSRLLVLITGARAAASSIRRPFRIAAVAGAAATIAAALLLTTGTRGSEAEAAAPEPTRSAAAPAPSARTASVDEQAIAGDDPAVAALALLSARAACLAAGNEACLGRVDATGSSLLESDLTVLSTEGSAPVLIVPPEGEPPLVQRTGDAAMVTTGQATLLLVREEGQWRLRDLFVPEPPGAQSPS